MLVKEHQHEVMNTDEETDDRQVHQNQDVPLLVQLKHATTNGKIFEFVKLVMGMVMFIYIAYSLDKDHIFFKAATDDDFQTPQDDFPTPQPIAVIDEDTFHTSAPQQRQQHAR